MTLHVESNLALTQPPALARWSSPQALEPAHDERAQFAATRNLNVALETQSPLAMGLTLIDWRGVSGRAPNVRVIETVDAGGVYRLLAERVARLP